MSAQYDDDDGLVDRLECLDQDDLSEWEEDFVASLSERKQEQGSICLTNPQREKAQQILEKHE